MSKSTIDDPCSCTKADLPELIALVNLVFRPQQHQNIFTDYPLVYHDENLANIQMIKVDGRIVSEVPFIVWPVHWQGCQFSVGFISPTATHPDHRHKGYGLRCLRSCIERMKQMGVDLTVLWTLVRIFPFYYHADYAALRPQVLRHELSNADANRFEHHGEQIVLYHPHTRQYLSDIQTMRQAGPHGVVRNDEQAATLLALPNQTTYLALRRTKAVAYLCVNESTNKTGVIEWGGDPEGIETLVRYILLERSPDKPVKTAVQICPNVMADLLEAKARDRQVDEVGARMTRINDVRGFFEKISPWLAKRHQGQVEPFSIGLRNPQETISLDFSTGDVQVGSQRCDQHLEMTRRELTSAIFGAHVETPYDPPPPLDRLFPFYFPISILDRS